MFVSDWTAWVYYINHCTSVSEKIWNHCPPQSGSQWFKMHSGNVFITCAYTAYKAFVITKVKLFELYLFSRALSICAEATPAGNTIQNTQSQIIQFSFSNWFHPGCNLSFGFSVRVIISTISTSKGLVLKTDSIIMNRRVLWCGRRCSN